MNDGLLAKTTVPTTRAATTVATDHVPPRPIVVVIGMHRSGTSLCAHVLSCLGVDMADEAAVNSGNAKGHWERLELMALHDRMLGLCNRGYFTPLHDLALPTAWWADPGVQAVKREIQEFLRRRIGVMPFGFKDPRTARLMPVWSQIFKELNLAPKFVLCLRNPAQVARSLRDRDHLDPQIGEYRWFIYLAEVFQFIAKHEFCLVEYENWFTEPERNLTKLQQFLEIDWPGSEADLNLAVSEIVDAELRHDDPHYTQAREPTIRWFYELVRAYPDDEAARQQTRRLVTQFAAFRKLQRPSERAFEGTVALADKVAPLEQDIATLQSAASERDAEIARMRTCSTAAQEELDARDAALAGLRQSCEEHRAAAIGLQAALTAREAALAEAEQGRAEQAAAADEARADLARVQAELAACTAALAEAEQGRAEQAAAADEVQADLARVQAELAARTGALAEAEQGRVEQAAVAGEARADLTRVQAELAARAAALAEADQRATQQAATAQRAQADLAQLRTEIATGKATVAEAHRTVSEHAAQIARLRQELERAATEQGTAAAGRAEIEALRNDLAIARQTAAATLSALRTDFAAPANGHDGIGWGRLLWRRSRTARTTTID